MEFCLLGSFVSISKFQEKFLSKTGCTVAISVGMCVIMSFFLFTSCGTNSQKNGEDSGETPVVSVGSTAITAQQVTDLINKSQATPAPNGAPPPPITYKSTAETAPGALYQLLSVAAIDIIASQDHIPLTDDAMLKSAKEAMESDPEMGSGPDREKRISTTLANIKGLLADPDPVKKKAIAAKLVPIVVRQAMIDSAPISAAEVKKPFDNYDIKQIHIPGGPNAKAQADEALKAIKGGMTFEAAMDKYSKTPAAKGKKVSDAKMTLPESMMAMIPGMQALDGKPAGFVTDATPDQGGFTISKIVSITNKPPADFDKNLAQYKSKAAALAVEKKMKDQISSILDSGQVKWDSNGYKALYDFEKTQLNPDPNGATTALMKVVEEAKTAANGNNDHTPALYAWYDAESILYNTPGANKANMAQDRIDVLNAVLQSSEDFDLRLELADLYIQKKDGVDALTQLVAASQANSTYDVIGQDHYRNIAAKGMQLTALKLVPADQLKLLTDAQDQWKKSKADDDKEQAQMKADEAKAQAQAQADEKKEAAALAKQKADAEKAGKQKTDATGATTVKPDAKPGAPSNPPTKP